MRFLVLNWLHGALLPLFYIDQLADEWTVRDYQIVVVAWPWDIQKKKNLLDLVVESFASCCTLAHSIPWPHNKYCGRPSDAASGIPLNLRINLVLRTSSAQLRLQLLIVTVDFESVYIDIFLHQQNLANTEHKKHTKTSLLTTIRDWPSLLSFLNHFVRTTSLS